MDDRPSLTIADPERMSLLGHMLGGILETNLARREAADIARRLRGSLGVTAGRMSVTLVFEERGVTIARGLASRLRARIRGSLDGLLQVSLGKGPVRAFLAGDVSFSGNPFFALKVLPLFRAPGAERGAP
jgi:hypothetical protein